MEGDGSGPSNGMGKPIGMPTPQAEKKSERINETKECINETKSEHIDEKEPERINGMKDERIDELELQLQQAKDLVLQLRSLRRQTYSDLADSLNLPRLACYVEDGKHQALPDLPTEILLEEHDDINSRFSSSAVRKIGEIKSSNSHLMSQLSMLALLDRVKAAAHKKLKSEWDATKAGKDLERTDSEQAGTDAHPERQALEQLAEMLHKPLQRTMEQAASNREAVLQLLDTVEGDRTPPDTAAKDRKFHEIVQQRDRLAAALKISLDNQDKLEQLHRRTRDEYKAQLEEAKKAGGAWRVHSAKAQMDFVDMAAVSSLD